MRTLEVKAESRLSKIIVGEQLMNLMNYLPAGKKIIITDTNVSKLYARQFPENIPVIEIGLGEKNKTLSTLDSIFEKLVAFEADRSTYIIGIGGGIVCDVAGFAASTYMRGVRFGFVSTTLLSQVDASVGGKNGVNFRGFKNMIGVFNQPDFVICDITMLQTLEEREFRAGFAEIIKAGAIKNDDLFKYCEDNYAGALDHTRDVVIKMVYDSVKVKADVVEADEKEKGERRLLNFGHTFAHSIEKMTDKYLHGEAVSIGMVLAAKVSCSLNMISADDVKRIENLLEKYQLPVKAEIKTENLFEAMKQDKKREGDFIHLVLLEKIGKAVTKKITYKELENIVYDLRSNFG